MKEKHSIIRQLRSQLIQIDGDLEAMKIELANKQKDLNSKRKIADQLKNKIKELESETDEEISISEHAYLRYFERVLNYDLKEIKKEIITDQVLDLTSKLGNSGSFPTGKKTNDGKEYRVALKNNVVVTVGI